MLIRVCIDDVEVEIDDSMPPTTLEAFESHLARVAGTCLSLYSQMVDDNPDKNPDDDGDGDDPTDGDILPQPIISFTFDETPDA